MSYVREQNCPPVPYTWVTNLTIMHSSHRWSNLNSRDGYPFFFVKFQRIQKPRTKVREEWLMSTFRLRVVSPQGDWPTSLIGAGHEPAHQVFTTRPLPQGSEQEPKKTRGPLGFIMIWPAALKSTVQSWGGSRRDEDQQIRGCGSRLEKGQTSLMWWRERE